MATKLNKQINVWLRVFVTVGLLSAFAYFLPVEMLLDAIRAISWVDWLRVIIIVQVGHIISALKWRRILNAAGVSVTKKDAILAHATGLFASLCLPSLIGGDVLRAGMLVKKHGQLEAVTMGSITDRIIDIFALMTLTAVASVFLPASVSGTINQVFSFIAFTLLFTALIGTAVVRWFPVNRLPPRLANAAKRLKIALKTLLSNPGTASVSFIVAIGIQGSFSLLNMQLANAMGIFAAPWVWIWAWPLAKLIALTPISLGGIGIREVALAGLLASFGIDTTHAVAQSLSWEVILIMTGLISGIAVVIFSGKKLSLISQRQEELKHRLISGMAWVFAGSWAEQVINFVIFIVLARLLGPEIFGLATMAMVFVVFAEILVLQTISETVIQLKNLEDGHLDAIFWSLGSLSILIVSLLIILAEPIANIFSEPTIANYLVWATPTILIIGFSGVPVSLLKRNLEFRSFAIRTILGILAGGIVGIIMALKGYGVWSFIAQRVVQMFVNYSIAWLAYPWMPKFRATRRHFQDVIGFSNQMIGLRITELISTNTPLVVIGAYLGPTILGQFSIAWRLVEILSLLLVVPIQIVAQPVFAHLDRAKKKAGSLLTNIIRISALISFPSFLGMAAVGASAIELFFGSKWIDAIPILQIICLVGIYLSIERLQQAFCLALGHARSLFYLSLAEAIIGIIVLIVFVDFGILGVATAFTLRYYIMWPFRFNIVAKIANTTPLFYVKAFVLPLINAIMMTLIITGWQQVVAEKISTFELLVSSIIIGILIYYVGVKITMYKQIQQLFAFTQSIRKTDKGIMNEA